ncbi:MAG: UvrD-helicase domain-containing protein [Puniceicoccales bacterium]|jgi:exodeoxyribonuclease V beta subunit|nr:UvrD-helicase domain-containing protein [Puniceicoccales bacterium]
MNEFDVLNAPLGTGVCALIEANAGTGKTHNIQHLYLRFVLEQGCEPKQLLVVTFTEAATAELRDRIRSNLTAAEDEAETQTTNSTLEAATADTNTNSAAAAASAPVPVPAAPPDPTLRAIVARALATHDAATVRNRLRVALTAFDEAAIYTIHGFCQRTLSRHAFDGKLPFGSKLATSLDTLIHDTVADFFRREGALGALRNVKFSELLDHARIVLARGSRLRITTEPPTAHQPADATDSDTTSTAALSHSFFSNAERLLAKIKSIIHAADFPPEPKPGKEDRAQKIRAPLRALKDLLSSADSTATTTTSSPASAATPSAAFLLAYDHYAPALADFVATGTERKDFADLIASARCYLSLPRIAAFAALREYLADPATGFEARKHKLQIIGFDDLLNKTQAALHAPECPLACALRDTYAVALVDEFQDTDPVQYAIFETVFKHPASRLFMIGDPKQAIYSFRGGDIQAYLAAAAAAPPENRTTLSRNFRSEERLVTAVNAVFGVPDAFAEAGVSLTPSVCGRAPKLRLLLGGEPPACPLKIVRVNGGAGVYSKSELTRSRFPERAAAVLVAELLDDASAKISENGTSRPVAAADIAVLVSSNFEAVRTQEAFRRLAIPAVILKAGNIFATADAENLWHILSAIDAPNRGGLVRTALLTPFCGVSEETLLAATAGESAAFARHCETFAALREVWRTRGVAAALAAFVEKFDALAHAADAAGPACERRLSNFRHLCELLAKAEAENEPDPDALLRWLREKITGDTDTADAEAHEQRMESDRRAVAVLTVHKSKGLEFPIVFCPFAATLDISPPDNSSAPRQWVVHDPHTGGLVLPVSDEARDAWEPLHAREQLAEHLRLLYVALTRASCLCVLFAGNIKGRSKSTGLPSALNYLGQLHRGFSQGPEGFIAEPPLPGSDPFPCAAGEMLDVIETVDFSVLDPRLRDTTPRAADTDADELAPPPPKPNVRADIGVLSYTALAAHGDTALAASAATTAAPESAALPAAGGDDEAPAPRDPENRDPLPAGKSAGLCVHEILEKLDYHQFRAAPPSPATAAILERAATRHAFWKNGEKTARAKARRERLLAILANTLATTLPDAAFALRDIPFEDTLREWEFFFRVPANIPLRRFRDAGLTFKPSADFRHGHMTGIIDLLFRRDGRYAFADWKTDTLPDYGGAALRDAMISRNYLFQASVYAVALHRWLRQTLGSAYDFHRHFGGGHYLFVRGLPPAANAAATPTGVFRYAPTEDEIEQLSHDFCGPD